MLSSIFASRGAPKGRDSVSSYSKFCHQQPAQYLAESAQCCCRSVTQLCLTLRPHELQHASLLCPPLSPRLCSNSCPLSQWCHPTISTSVASFSSCPQYFPASGSFPVSQLFSSGGQSIGASSFTFCVAHTSVITVAFLLEIFFHSHFGFTSKCRLLLAEI